MTDRLKIVSANHDPFDPRKSWNWTITRKTIYDVVAQSKWKGATSLEIEDFLAWRHGRVSGPLTAMHEKHILFASDEPLRNDYRVYYLPEYIGDHPRAYYKPNTAKHSEKSVESIARDIIKRNSATALDGYLLLEAIGINE